MQQTPKPSALALLPLAVFIGLFLGTGWYLTLEGYEYAFYQLPAPVAILPALVLAIFLGTGSRQQNIETFVKGVGHSNIITMCLIYLLAGAFSSVAKATGSVDASVNLGLSLLNADFLLPGLFIISAFMATAMGTSMGTIAAIAPIALGIAQASGLELYLVSGAIVSGAMLGDNLSVISDTTIAATRTQGCDMKDKFRQNIRLALPAAAIAFVGFYLLGSDAELPPASSIDWFAVFPYALVLILAVSGVNVFAVLLIGIVAAAFPALLEGEYTPLGYAKDIYAGFGSMQEIFILSLLIGGLSELIKQQGGLSYISNLIQSAVARLHFLPKQKAAALGIGGLVAATNTCVANNTVSIIITGDVAKALADDARLPAKLSASLLDIFACIIQGLLPYGAQALLLGSLFSISPVEAVAGNIYAYLLAAVVLLSLLFKRPKSDVLSQSQQQA